MKTPLSLLVALLCAAPLAAQDAPAGKAVGTFTPPSCGEPGLALEKASFELTVPGAKAPMRLIYAGCDTEGRNDYLPGYTERTYKGTDGYTLTLVTDHDDGAFPSNPRQSDVLVAKGKDWVARFGVVPNATLEKSLSAAKDGYALSTAQALPSTAACDAKLPKPIYGPNEMWFLTPTKAFYYHEDCDICAELDSCDLKTGAMKEEIVAHMVSCDEAKAKTGGEKILAENCSR